MRKTHNNHQPRSGLLARTTSPLLLCLALILGLPNMTASANNATDSQKPSQFATNVLASHATFPLVSLVQTALQQRQTIAPFNTRIIEISNHGGARLFCTGPEPHLPSTLILDRALSNEEKALCKRNQIGVLSELKIGYSGIIIAQTKGRDNNLSMEALIDQFSGNSSGNARPGSQQTNITIAIPPKETPVRHYWEHVMVKFDPSLARQEMISGLFNLSSTVTLTERYYSPDEITKELSSTAPLLFFTNLSFLVANPLNPLITSIDNIRPSIRGIRELSYPLAHPIYVYLKIDHLRIKPQILSILAHLVDPDALKDPQLIEKLGILPPSDALKDFNLDALFRLGQVADQPTKIQPARGSVIIE